jgi:hypothetical protein
MKKLKQFYYKLADNPILGVVPLQVFVLADYFMSYSSSLLAGFLTSAIISLIILSLSGRGKIYYILFLITSIITLSVSTILYFITALEPFLYSFYSPFVTEITFVIVMFSIVMFKQQIQLFIIKTAKSNVAISILDSIDEYVYISTIILYTLATHLVLTGAYFLLPGLHNDIADLILVWVFPPLFMSGLFIFEYSRLGYLQKKLDNEEWLAVVDEKGKVIGKIAKSETAKMGNKYLHPMVRIAVAYNGRLFLAPRPEKLLLDPGSMDHPFEKYVKYEHTLDEAAANLLKIYNLRTQDLKPRFSIKYLFENEKTRRLIFLYTIEAYDESIFNRQKFPNGKFWTQKQIEDNIGAGFFSECFEKEYEYLKNTLLLFCSPNSDEENDEEKFENNPQKVV